MAFFPKISRPRQKTRIARTVRSSSKIGSSHMQGAAEGLLIRRRVKQHQRDKILKGGACTPDKKTISRFEDTADILGIQKLTNVTDVENLAVVYGAYGVEDWYQANFLKTAILNGQNLSSQDGSWIRKTDWCPKEFAKKHAKSIVFTAVRRAYMFFDWGYADVVISEGKITFEMYGVQEGIDALIEKIDADLDRAENLIDWVYSPDGSTISVPLNYRPAIDGAYPWLGDSMENYIDAYLNSDAAVLILIGPPGTGKTTFIKNMIHRAKTNAMITYDERVMSSDSLFASFIDGNNQFLIMEDADTFLKARENGNTMMHRFLNVSDGLISTKGKKLVFSTNLPSIRDVDEALMRPGRCFGVAEFRAFDRTEARIVADKVGIKDLPDTDKITLAEIFGSHNSATGIKPKRKVGFV